MIYDAPDWAGYLRFRDQFVRLLDPRCFTPDWLDQQVLKGAFRVFVGIRSAILTSVKTYPTGARELRGQAAAVELPGALDEVRQSLIPEAEKYADLIGCFRTRIDSRPAWAKILKEDGFEPFQLSIVKDL